MDANDAISVRIIDATQGEAAIAEGIRFVSDAAFGGIDVFIGRVRSANHGRSVTGITYDLFDPLALALFRKAGSDARQQYGGRLKAYVAHAKGELRVGDVAVVVAVGTPHRDEAFRGCRDIIERVKHEAPIWKQEHYIDGSSEWSEGCTLCGREPRLR